mmetsp:Transcript_52781/g.140304  ORF Transcript_52781/g.140304 Transcript_52781/m.140304 type:complete len:227 (+) Transcript_52781:580-1260(+)
MLLCSSSCTRAEQRYPGARHRRRAEHPGHRTRGPACAGPPRGFCCASRRHNYGTEPPHQRRRRTSLGVTGIRRTAWQSTPLARQGPTQTLPKPVAISKTRPESNTLPTKWQRARILPRACQAQALHRAAGPLPKAGCQTQDVTQSSPGSCCDRQPVLFQSRLRTTELQSRVAKSGVAQHDLHETWPPNQAAKYFRLRPTFPRSLPNAGPGHRPLWQNWGLEELLLE